MASVSADDSLDEQLIDCLFEKFTSENAKFGVKKNDFANLVYNYNNYQF